MKNRVASHLKEDIKHEMKAAKDDRKLLKSVSHKKKKAAPKKKHHKKVAKKKHESKKMAKKHEEHPKHRHTHKKAVGKFKKVMKEFKEGSLHSGSKKGPKVSNPKQAVAIAYSEDRRLRKQHGEKIKRK